MPLTKEEIAADLVWRYIEHVRESPESERLSDEEMSQLVAVLQTASLAGDALGEEQSETRQAAVRQRVEQLLGSRPTPTAGSARKPSRAPGLLALVPAWRFRAACGAAAVLALALGTVSFWYHAPPVVVRETKYIAFPKEIPGLEAMNEETAHEMLPKMVHSQLREKDEKNLMGHLLVCPGCYRHYVELRQERQGTLTQAGPVHLASHW